MLARKVRVVDCPRCDHTMRKPRRGSDGFYVAVCNNCMYCFNADADADARPSRLVVPDELLSAPL